jgi:hypothetical protein
MAGILWTVGYKRRAVPPETAPGAGELRESGDSRATASKAVGEGAPESAVWRLVDAARAGDPGRYLECYTGDLKPRIRRDFQEMGPVRSRDYLVDAHRQLKGVTVRSPQMSSAFEAQLPVEYVYEDRNEVQRIYVKKVDGLWKIDRVDGAERIKTPVPYGTPVER